MDAMTGTLAVIIGVIIFLMGYFKGTKRGTENAVNHMFESGILDVDSKGNIVAGSKLSTK